MEAVGGAVGIASLGIQVCHGLLSYYDSWKDYKTDVSEVRSSITNLSKTLEQLRASLKDNTLDGERRDRVKNCVESCEKELQKLSKKLQKLRTHTEPEGARQRAWSELQRAWYPLRASTLAKLREVTDEVCDRLQLALQVLHLDVSTASQKVLVQVAADTKETVVRAKNIETEMGQLAADTKETVVRAKNIETGVGQVAAAQQSEQFCKLVNWLSAPDPWTNHHAACQQHEAQTGSWLLWSDHFRKWKAGSIPHLGVYGKAGCGKTVLCSTVIEDMRAHCANATNVGHAMFYFSFSDSHKQSYESMLRSVIQQLCWKGPGLTMLLEAYDRYTGGMPGVVDLEGMLLASIELYNVVYVHLDALDECPEANDVRQNMLDRLELLLRKTPRLRLFVTSRELSDVRDSMERTPGLTMLPIPSTAVNADIKKYVSTQLAKSHNFRGLGQSTKALIEDTLSKKADGMFRWASCQLQELKKLKSKKPKYVKDVLYKLPTTLDETYKRMLLGIEERYRDEALTLLRWLNYAKQPLSLRQLAVAAIINPDGETLVDVDNLGDWQDTLDILSGLVTHQYDGEMEYDEADSESFASHDLDDVGDSSSPGAAYRPGPDTKIRLAHFSVQEYLQSQRLAECEARFFRMSDGREHRLLARSCIAYLFHYSGSKNNESTRRRDLEEYPLLAYAARSWFYHSSLQQPGDVGMEMCLLTTDNLKNDWLRVYNQYDTLDAYFSVYQPESMASGLYCASASGLEAVVKAFIEVGTDVNACSGPYGSAMAVAALRGFETIVRMLLDAGADVDARGRDCDTALQAASLHGHEEVVKLLLDAGANVDARGGGYGLALQAASFSGCKEVVKLLLDAGANVDARGGGYGTALQAASFRGCKEVVKLLLDAGADVNAQGSVRGSALRAARRGWSEHNECIIQILLDAGAVEVDYSSSEEAGEEHSADEDDTSSEQSTGKQPGT